MSDFDVDLFVIGAGSGGVRAARIAAGHGAKVMVAEEYRVGGTCVIRGCVPKKLLVYASRYAHEFEDAAGFGWTIGDARFDWASLIAAKDREIARLEGAYTSTLAKSGAELVKSRAILEDAHDVRLTANGARVRARHILVATGARPELGHVPGHELAITSDEAFHLERQPRRIIIQGGGYIAIEFAGIFAGLGSEVILVHRGDKLLRGFDEDVRDHLGAELGKHGIRLALGRGITRIEAAGDGRRVTLTDGTVEDVDQVMIAIGRKPNTRDLGLERAGVALDRDGAVVVDGWSRSSVPSIAAVGDVTNRMNLTPVAIREGHAFADTVFGGKPTRVDHDAIPTAVFSEPEVGCVGLTEEAARERLPAVDIYKTTFRPMKATLSGRDTRVLMKLVVDGETDRVLGCHIIGADAGEMVQMVAIAIRMGARKADFDATMALHPTAAEELVTMRSPTARHRRAGAA